MVHVLNEYEVNSNVLDFLLVGAAFNPWDVRCQDRKSACVWSRVASRLAKNAGRRSSSAGPSIRVSTPEIKKNTCFVRDKLTDKDPSRLIIFCVCVGMGPLNPLDDLNFIFFHCKHSLFSELGNNMLLPGHFSQTNAVFGRTSSRIGSFQSYLTCLKGWHPCRWQRLRNLTASAPWFVTGHEAHAGVTGYRASAQDAESACSDCTDVSNVVTVKWRPWRLRCKRYRFERLLKWNKLNRWNLQWLLTLIAWWL